MKRAVKIGVAFAIFQLVESGVLAQAETMFPGLNNKLWWIDNVIYAILGFILVLNAVRLPLAFATGACVATFDATFGFSISWLVHTHGGSFWQAFFTNFTVYPSVCAVATGIGALIAMPFAKRPVD